MAYSPIRIENARQNNLKNINVSVPVGAVTAVTGVAGAGKSSLAFEVLYAEGYRRYVETFSPYARQFLERLDRPDADRIDGVLPGIAIGRTAPVQTSRSTVGTITSIDDYLRSLFARSATLYCEKCGQPVVRDNPSSVFDALAAEAEGEPALVGFTRRFESASADAVRGTLRQAGFSRVLEHQQPKKLDDAALDSADGHVTVILDRLRIERSLRKRIVDSIEAAFRFGAGQMEARVGEKQRLLKFSTGLHCAACDIEYADPAPAMFSFNNPVGACETCNGFGRIIDIDPDLVIPDPDQSVADGAIRPFQTPTFSVCQDDLMAWMKQKKLPYDRPWRKLDDDLKQRIWDGDPSGSWYGIGDFFDWLQRRRYKKQARIFLSRFRQYLLCPACHGARLKPRSLQYKINGHNFAALQQADISEAAAFFSAWTPPQSDEATDMLVDEIRGRLRFLCDVGLSYLTLGRQSRTLSGGETQRVTLATALGSSLTSTLYVLDEPSVGLHPRDKIQLAGVLSRLAAAGNAVVVVEHDPAFIRTADRVIDLGPGPGAAGGNVVHQGTLAGLLKKKDSPTAQYLRGDLEIPRPETRRTPSDKHLRIVGARENNLKNVTVDVPLGLVVCVTGVSGSGKSSLIDAVLYRNLRREKGLQAMEPGRCEHIEGHESIHGAVLVDQSPLSRNARMNAATYMKVLDPIRSAFAATKQARQMGLTRSAFSFNTAEGACPHCEGAGFERVELQFLPDVYIRCPGCDGKRFRPYVLDVRYKGFNIAEVLAMPARDVADLFAGRKKLERAIQPLLDIGLGYLSLSQSAPTLSGGEAQRLKLARHLGEAAWTDNQLFLLDEPTTGLHPANISDLARAVHQITDNGHSVIIIEHDMDVAKAADWIIDLGPDGGDQGGQIVGEGPPERIAELDTATGYALRQITAGEAANKAASNPGAAVSAAGDGPIRIVGAREHNLADIDVSVPRNRLVAVTGVSGSGKSTLAFDVLYSEGRERFLDCLPAYARQYVQPLSRAEVDRIEALPPTIALEQKVSRAGAMSTAGTVSEIYHYLRLLFANLGVPFCPKCGVPGQTANPDEIVSRLIGQFGGRRIRILAPLIRKRKGFHDDVMKRAAKQGFAKLRVDGGDYDAKKPPRLDRYKVHDVAAEVADFTVAEDQRPFAQDAVAKGLEAGTGALMVAPDGDGPEHFFSTRRACPTCGAGLPVSDPRLFTWSQKFGACSVCEGSGTAPPKPGQEDGQPPPCPACEGTRLRPEARAVKIGDDDIGAVAKRSVTGVRLWIEALGPVQGVVSEQVVPELLTRLQLLESLGVGYLTLDRATNSLSTGEAQRIRIAAELSSNLRGVCYVLDEPTVGLHPHNVLPLVQALSDLRDRGNAVVVVEHEEPVIRAADHVIDIGPGAGTHGGQIVATGTPKTIQQTKASVTGQWLRGMEKPPLWSRKSLKDCDYLTVSGAKLHNLKDVSVRFPLGRLVCVTGVSGSGKSTLVRDIAFRAVKDRLAGKALPPVLKNLKGTESVKSAKEVDESPIGRTPRSVPATYVGVMDDIRKIFAQTPEARASGYTAARFSFNVSGGRCEACNGQGRHRVEMPLLPVVHIPCDVCGGRRYNPDTLAVTYKDKTIADVLAMTIDEALEFFGVYSRVVRPLQFLSDIGLGYITLGQPSPTLSGGEAQRMKLAAELASRASAGGFYVLDEPSTGLHMADVAKLVAVLQRMVDRGDTVVVIEHDMDVIAAADCIIDMGPDGGPDGGRVVARGSPEEVAESRESQTAGYLRQYLKRMKAGKSGKQA
ncbi:MAG: excinuclease ABC subunit UvrA [Thermodesulfobacteriota bacterium]